MELIIMLLTGIFIYMYRKSPGNAPYKYFQDVAQNVYDTYAPYSYKVVKEKAKELGQDYTMKQYIVQVLLFGGVGAGIAFLYFYSPFCHSIHHLYRLEFQKRRWYNKFARICLVT